MEINNHEKKVYSQNGEDGVIEYIFNNIGFTNKLFVEFGFEFYQNNSRHLIEKYGFKGLFIDYNMPDQLRGKNINGVIFHKDWITKNNINKIIGKYYKGNIDFLSIDVDGVDLYLLDIIDVVSPRVVCTEFCASIGKQWSVTVVYKDDFDRHKEHKSGFYCNASLKANINVMKKKGYKFVGCVAGLNAFFVRNDCNMGNLKELTCEEGWQPHYTRTFVKCPRHDGTYRNIPAEEQFNMIKDLKWIQVDEMGQIEMIPNVLFTSYKADQSDPLVQNILNTWKDKNPGFTIKYFSDKDIDEFFKNTPHNDIFAQMKNGVAKADWFRAYYIYKHGGFWFDLDMAAVKIPSNVISHKLAFFNVGYQNISYMLIGGQPNQTIFNEIIEQVAHNVQNNLAIKTKGVMDITGPRVLQNIVCSKLQIENKDGCLPASDGESKIILKDTSYEFIYTGVKVASHKIPEYAQLQNKYKQLHYSAYNFI